MPQFAARLPSEYGEDPSMSSLFIKRSIFVALALLTLLGIILWCWFAGRLSATERQFVGTWSIMPSGPRSVFHTMTLSPDRRLLLDGKPDPESTWSVANGQLRMHHHYKISLMRGMPTLPGARHTETFGWSATFSENGNRLDLTHMSPAPDPAFNRVLRRKKTTD